MIEPRVSQFVIIQTRITNAALADHGIFGRPLVSAVQRGRNYRVLLVGNVRPRSLAHKIVCGQIWSYRYVVPGHEPKSGHVNLHVVMPQAAFVPGRIVWRALDHGAAGVYRHVIGKDSAWAIDSLDNVFFRKVPKRL